ESRHGPPGEWSGGAPEGRGELRDEPPPAGSRHDTSSGVGLWHRRSLEWSGGARQGRGELRDEPPPAGSRHDTSWGVALRRGLPGEWSGGAPEGRGELRDEPPPAGSRHDTSSGAGRSPGAGMGAGAEALGDADGGVDEVRPEAPSEAPSEARPAPAWRTRAGLAVRERMPLWLQTRCGLERRSVAALTAVLVVAAVLAAQHFWSGRTQPVRAPEIVRAAVPYGEETNAAGQKTAAGPSTAAQAPPGAGAAPTALVVDVSGKVREPGIHRLPAGSRVADALKAAGGVRPGTDTEGLNRARFLVDGEQVLVGAPAAVGPGAPGAAGTSGAAGPGGAAPAPVTPVALNTATLEQLDTLPGVGPVLAQHIIDYRGRHGGFRSVDELREVNGIGDRRFADLRNLVRP
ncbi:ComEA family DNA-binding protein, partial [Streptomyces dioscori]